ncbi:glycoside hydrolase family 2 TIM barrel-domain containing protein [Pedobacter rhizosphaerae]|uniref:Glycosyl hydrolases family 2, TIM barrel domain n=1 Tax=Pedobacter rhizosphaerae TaxID=390241 RepID=A0A1H9SJD2_9SPHI|nr:glycoside hydrolase family 2 TIM barrel-domain containing protein [Pedobacter rhizosphaerae]SER85057.1 Glycosyl hydrolases family 2, TIM barrel domain [Pedobacter rhizosphaerae]
MSKKITFFLFLTAIALFGHAQTITLAGQWDVKLDSNNVGKANHWFKGFTSHKISLPGTLDDAKIGKQVVQDTLNINKPVLLSLTRKHRYIGAAWYAKEIVIKENMDGAELSLERVIWKTECWVDGVFKGNAESLSTAQKFSLGSLKAGKHTIVLKIDNTKQHDISFNDFAHAYTDGTQIIWNGVIGEIKLTASPEHHIKQLQIYPDGEHKKINVNLLLDELKNKESFTVKYKIYKDGVLIATKLRANQNAKVIKNELQLNDVKLWDEFNPDLYTLKVELLNKKSNLIAQASSTFGFRKLGNQGGGLTLNGKRIFLRGTLDCNIYPIQGHPPMDKEAWVKVFKVIKDYGLNHIRYHSWCPPEAAFQVADSLGLYLQVELPLWSLKVGENKATLKFLEDESQRIMASYGNHPSFCFWSMGNELEGDFAWLNNLVAKLKKEDPRRFYTATTFSFQKGHGLAPEPHDDFFITQYTKKGWVRGQGVFNAEVPRFDKDYQQSADSLSVPLVAHEVGQYSVYPNLKEIEKYTGVLAPLNFKTIRHDLQKKNLYSLADSFKLASGKFAALLYKEEIERALKTKEFSGFQLLDLHDFPGQGTALVGLLDAFWESKGIITPKEFRAFSSSVVPLLKFKNASYLNDQLFNAELQVANFGKDAFSGKAAWKVTDQQGKVLKSGNTVTQEVILGTSSLGKVAVDLSSITQPTQLTFELSIENTPYQNSWNFWVYPKTESPISSSVIFTTSKNEAFAALKQGKTVVLNPDTAMINGIPGRFTSVFWSPVHFPDQPGSMGLLCNPSHPVFNAFPTTFFSNWQWWDLITKSKSLNMDEISDQHKPLVRIIDNFYKNRKLGTLLEGRVGKGKLILCTMDITHQLENRIEARQLKNSIMQYADSNRFSPKAELSVEALEKWLK